MGDTWAAKVLEGVERYKSGWRSTHGEDIRYADALAAIARMGAGDDLVERLLVDNPVCEEHHTSNEAAAHIAALTAQVAELNRRAAVTRDARYNQGYADCLNSGGVADARAEAHSAAMMKAWDAVYAAKTLSEAKDAIHQLVAEAKP